MVQSTRSVLVYERIDANRRNSRWLIAAFIVLLLPLACGVAQHLTIDSIFTAANPDELIQPPPGAIYEELVNAVTVVLAIAGASAIVATFFSSSILLQHVGAHRIGPDEEINLRRTVENLCIGAGLPVPAIYLVNSDIANSFALGRDPEHASLVVTTGLLGLLSQRELTGVIAHELSHIGNYDTRLGTLLAAIVATLRWPWSLASKAWSSIKAMNAKREDGKRVRNPIGALLYLARPLLLVVSSMVATYVAASDRILSSNMPAPLFAWRLLGIAAPFYLVLAAPLFATELRRTISKEREYLADADAVLLTRDPGGLALALAKVGRAVAPGSKAGAATAHLYFVDPLPASSAWWDDLYDVHPPPSDRIARLAEMGTGIPPAELEAAEKIGVEYSDRLYQKMSLQQLPPELVPPDPIEWAKRYGKPLVAFEEDGGIAPGTKFRLTGHTPLFKAADGLSAASEVLHEQTVITVVGQAGSFVRVNAGTASGYISGGTTVKPCAADSATPSAAPAPAAHELPADEDEPGLTPMYELPDGWSRIVARLPRDVAIKSATREGNFIRVTTGDNTVGYVPQSAQLIALGNVRVG
jgi:heat shock protein HtpX